ncbi:MAG: M23 family metallopeptidase [Ignavibacteriae bacterium]|nr:M23 family metallopeptidase [Ignavibacteriota bacterium]
MIPLPRNGPPLQRHRGILFAAVLIGFTTATVSAQTPESIADIDRVFRDIYELRASRKDAAARMKAVAAFLKRHAVAMTSTAAPRSSWVFPLRGYGPAAIGGKNGEGYRAAASYDFFDGNSHGGHPAHDVFIRDRDYDDKDDRTKQPVEVLSITSGVVVCINREWTPDSMDSKRRQSIRGGKYVWVYDPGSDGLMYYAHLREVSCVIGQFVGPGDLLGTVGRTGKNAFPHRSPTHLHLMFLAMNNGHPRPEDIFADLKKAMLAR